MKKVLHVVSLLGVAVMVLALGFGNMGSQVALAQSGENNPNSSSTPAGLIPQTHFSYKPVCQRLPDDKPGTNYCMSDIVTDAMGNALVFPMTLASAPYGPAQFRGAYGVSGTTSINRTVAIVDAYDDPYALSDLNAYSTHFGIPTMNSCAVSTGTTSHPCFQKVNENGGSTPPATDGYGINGWAGEISLDLDAVHAMCQNCNILLVEASVPSNHDLIEVADQTAVSMGANVVSNSWGGPESSGEASLDGNFNHPGVPFVFSTGDDGYGVQYPSASRNVTAVGGTKLMVNTDNSYNSETVWGATTSGAHGAGSGCSAYEAKPSFQHDVGCTRRTVADVSADADPNTGAYVRYNGSGYQFGGTSLAAPLVASIFALAGGVGSTLGNSLPYANYHYGVNLRDVTSGANGNCAGSYLCTGKPGYDGPTGLGTPLGFTAFKGGATTGPTPISPSGTISDTTPTFTWSKASGATQYQFAVYQGASASPKYTKIVPSSACGTNCSNTPTTVLSAGAYKWQVRAYVSGVWKAYSSFKTFTVAVANSNPKAGYWSTSGGGLMFYVTPAQNNVKNFAVYVSACGYNWKVTHTVLVPISNKHFSFTGPFYGSGTFSSATADSGQMGFNKFNFGYCIASGGPWSYSATWKNSTQSSVPTSTIDDLVTNLGLSVGQSGFYQAVQVDAP